MILIQVASGTHPQQVDDFGPGVERSVKGALHFRPNTLRTLTKGEYEHICSKHSHLAKKLRVLKDTEGTTSVSKEASSKTVSEASPVVESNPETYPGSES